METSYCSITSTGAPSLNSAWQEGASSSTANPVPGFGTHITGGTIANGFDQSPSNSSGLKFLNGSGNWASIPNTTTTTVTDHAGYMFFVRGSRSYGISATTSSTTPSATVLRVQGNINQGTQAPVTVFATGYTLVGNPYASPIDFAQVIAASTNILNRFRVWDPQLGY